MGETNFVNNYILGHIYTNIKLVSPYQLMALRNEM